MSVAAVTGGFESNRNKRRSVKSVDVKERSWSCPRPHAVCGSQRRNALEDVNAGLVAWVHMPRLELSFSPA